VVDEAVVVDAVLDIHHAELARRALHVVAAVLGLLAHQLFADHLVPWLEMLPSEYFRRQCWISFDPDESMLAFTANSPLCGADRIIWASDHPHPDAKFPG
jgi:hypothetical protein